MTALNTHLGLLYMPIKYLKGFCLLQPCDHTCWERADPLALLCVMMFPYVFATLPYGVLGKVRYLIALIPDLCLLNFYEEYKVSTFKLNQGR